MVVAAIAFASYLSEKAAQLQPRDGKTRATLVGMPAFVKPIERSVGRNMVSHILMFAVYARVRAHQRSSHPASVCFVLQAMMYGIVLPAALLVLGWVLRTWRLMLIPLATLVTSLAVSFLIMWAVARATVVVSTVPALMVSMMLAMCVDYSLFLLVRYRTELVHTNGHSGIAVLRMVRNAGGTIGVSGGTLVLCFLALLLFPLDSIRTLGVGCAVAIGTTLLVNETLVPVLLLCFPAFFKRSVEPLTCPPRCCVSPMCCPRGRSRGRCCCKRMQCRRQGDGCCRCSCSGSGGDGTDDVAAGLLVGRHSGRRSGLWSSGGASGRRRGSSAFGRRRSSHWGSIASASVMVVKQCCGCGYQVG